MPTLRERFTETLQNWMEWLYEEDLSLEQFIDRINRPIGILLKMYHEEKPDNANA